MPSLLLWLVCVLLGQVSIAQENRIPNRTGSQCVWSSLESIGRHFGVAQLYDLTAKYKGTSDPYFTNRVLNSRGVKAYWSPETRNHDWQSLENAINGWHWPAAVGLSGTHMLLLVGITKDEVTIIDNGGKYALKEQQWSRKEFDRIWDGWFTVIPNPKDLQ